MKSPWKESSSSSSSRQALAIKAKENQLSVMSPKGNCANFVLQWVSVDMTKVLSANTKMLI